MPASPKFQHRIENRQQLAHAGGECHLLRLSHSLQTLINDTDHGIEPGGNNDPHIENSTHLRTANPHISLEMSRYHNPVGPRPRGRDLVIRQCAEFLETCQEGRGQDLGYAWHTLQESIFFPSHETLTNLL